VHQRRADAIDPFTNAAVGESDRGDVGDPAAQVNLDLHQAGFDADEDRPRGSTEHVMTLEEAGGTVGTVGLVGANLQTRAGIEHAEMLFMAQI
jgi:hypothetical protein